jgi:hypothetical protein
MASKFAEFLTAQGIDPRRLIAASRQIERIRPEDRKVRLSRRLARLADSAPTEKFPKTRSGRPITEHQIGRASAGDALPAPVKTRLLRAVNRVLELKKRPPVTLQSLF